MVAAARAAVDCGRCAAELLLAARLRRQLRRACGGARGGACGRASIGACGVLAAMLAAVDVL
eukprot:5709241-Alexandrium_andersonii.AAC.1